MAKKEQRQSAISIKRKRRNVQAKLWEIINAIVDDEQLHIKHGSIEFTQHDGANMLAYALLSTGQLNEEQYDLLRDVVNENGGKLDVLGAGDTPGSRINYNMRVWAVSD